MQKQVDFRPFYLSSHKLLIANQNNRLHRKVAGGSDRMLVEITDTVYNPDSRQVEYSLGKILELDIKSNLHK